MTRHVRRGVIAALVLTAVNVLGRRTLRSAAPEPATGDMEQRVRHVVVRRVIEEIPYRGFMLRKFASA